MIRSCIWGCGQGMGAVHAVKPVTVGVARLEREYRQARQRLAPTWSSTFPEGRVWQCEIAFTGADRDHRAYSERKSTGDT